MARLVKEELSLETTPSTEMGETPQEVSESIEEPVPESEVHVVEASPVIIGATKSDPKLQPKGNLVMNLSTNVHSDGISNV